MYMTSELSQVTPCEEIINVGRKLRTSS